MGGDVKIRYDGLIREKLPSGNLRYRVRVEGDTSRKITLPISPEHPDFHQHYRAARGGIRLKLAAEDEAQRGTLQWLADGYIAHLSRMVDAGQASPYTLKERANLMKLFLAQESSSGRSRGRIYAGLPVSIPHHELIALRDRFADKPAKAKNIFKMLRAMYKWGEERGHVAANPAAAIKVEYSSQGGATPWSLDDLKQFREVHPPGTMAHLTLTLFMFTACRIGDAYRLGRANEVKRGGVTWLEWQPRKRGSSFVQIPMLAPLQKALRQQTVIGEAYLLTGHGKPFTSAEGLRNRLKKWCREAGLEDRSSHGIRKAAGHLLALNGATQYEIMAVHGHANATTSEVYTKAVERMKLGEMAANRLAGMDW